MDVGPTLLLRLGRPMILGSDQGEEFARFPHISPQTKCSALLNPSVAHNNAESIPIHYGRSFSTWPPWYTCSVIIIQGKLSLSPLIQLSLIHVQAGKGS